MKTNKVLSVAAGLFKFMMGFVYACAIFTTFALIHSEIDPVPYNEYIVKYENGFKVINSTPNTLPPETYAEYTNSNDKTIYFSKLSFGSKFSIWVFIVIASLISILILKELIRFVQSAKKYDSFFINNSLGFIRMTRYVGVYFILDCVMSFWLSNLKMIFPDGVAQRYIFHVNFNFIPIIIMLFLLILSQVFKEGERMKQENELTI